MHYNVRYNPASNESRTKLLPSEIRWDTNGTVFTSVENMGEFWYEKKWSKSLWRLYVLWTQRNLVYTDACYYCLCSKINEETKNNCSNYRSTGYSFYFNLSSGTVLTVASTFCSVTVASTLGPAGPRSFLHVLVHFLCALYVFLSIFEKN